jgi:hypothetical protein
MYFYFIESISQEPTVPQEYILKGVVNAAVGQENGSREHLKIAQQYFQVKKTIQIKLVLGYTD